MSKEEARNTVPQRKWAEYEHEAFPCKVTVGISPARSPAFGPAPTGELFVMWVVTEKSRSPGECLEIFIPI